MDGKSTETIFALSSGVGRAAVSIVRLSGPSVRFVLETMAGGLSPPRKLVRRRLRTAAYGDVLDDALVVFFPAPASFTGEDCAELQIHGGLAVRAAVLRALSDTKVCRPANAGEFTRRAFVNGKLDLAAVEGLADLIDAETEGQRRQALRQLEGALSAAVLRWAEQLTICMARLEALIDFSDEGDVDGRVLLQVSVALRELSAELSHELERARRGESIREGFRIAISGPVNAGKSSLLNALIKRDAAIVSDVPGTTRDVIEVKLDMGGLPVLLADTAGTRETRDPVEAIGIARGKDVIESADLVLQLSELREGPPEADGLRVGTKVDLYPDAAPDGFDVVISTVTGAGLDRLLDLVRSRLIERIGDEDGLVTRERHRLALEAVCQAVSRCEMLLHEETLELAAEDLRLALRRLGEITGKVGVEEILDRLFSSFCIGK